MKTSHFWTHKDNIPAGLGYGQFTSKHSILMIITVLFTCGYVAIYLHASPDVKLFLLKAVGSTLIFIDVIKMILIARSPVRLSEYLPLEICSFAAYFICLDAFIPSSDFSRQMLLFLFLPAAIMAIIFPTTSTLPAFNFYSIHQFLYHGLIVAYIIARFAANEIPMDYPGVWSSIIKVLILVIIMYFVDVRFQRNFMFLRETYDNPMLEIIWKKTGGGFAYTAGLVCFAIAVIHVFFLIFKTLSIFIR